MAFAAQQALKMLAQNIPASQVAAALGVDPSYISQLMADEDFAAQLKSMAGTVAEQDIAFDEKLEETEQKLLDNIAAKSHFANFAQSLAGFKIVNAAKKRRDKGALPQQQGATQIVNILLPISVVPEYKMNSVQEIVEVNGKTMVSASPKSIENLLQARKAAALPPAKIEQTEQLLEDMNKRPQRRLPRNVISADML